MSGRSVVMAKFEYTVKFNGKKYLPGEDVPLESEITTETVAVTEEVAVAESAVEEEPKKETAPKETKSKSKGGRKPKA